MTPLNSNFNIELLNSFLQKNPEFQVADFDPSDEHAFDQYLLDDGMNLDQLLPVLAAYKRVSVTGVSDTVAKKLLATGIDSALQIAELPRLEYEQLVVDAGGADTDVVAYDRALTIKNKCLLTMLDVMQQDDPYLSEGLFHSVSETIHEQASEWMKITRHENGKNHSGRTSVFSPAAYYEDLKKLRKDYLEFPNNEPSKPFKLENRRKDLENIKPTSESSFDLIPHLAIVNKVLEPLVVDKDKPWWKVIAEKTFPFNLPSNPFLKQCHTYLGHLRTNTADFYRTFADIPSIEILAREYLQLSMAEQELIFTATDDEVKLQAYYGGGLDTPIGGWEKQLSSVREFLYRTGLTRAQLDELLSQNLHPDERHAGYSRAFYINDILASRPLYLYIDTNNGDETLQVKENATARGLLPTPAHFDRLHRFIRLSQRMGWSFYELDLVIRTACKGELDKDALPVIAAIRYLQNVFGLSLAELQCLWSPLDSLGFGAGPQFVLTDPFNSVFNNSLAAASNSYILPRTDKEAVYEQVFGKGFPILKSTDPDVNTRLLGAFHIGKEEMALILSKIPDQEPYKEPLSLARLSLINRYVQLSRSLKLSVADLMMLLELLQNDPHMADYNPFDIFVPLTKPLLKDVHALLRSQQPSDMLWLTQLLQSITVWLRENKLSVAGLAALCYPNHKSTLTPEQLRELFQNLQRKFRQVLVKPEHLHESNKKEHDAPSVFEALSVDGHLDKGHRGIVCNTEFDTERQTLYVADAIKAMGDRQEESVYKVLATSLGVTELQIGYLVSEAYKYLGLLIGPPVIDFIMTPILEAEENITPDLGTDDFKTFFRVLQALAEVTKRFNLSADDLDLLIEKRKNFQFDSSNPLGKLSLSNLRTLSDLPGVTIPDEGDWHIRYLIRDQRRERFVQQLGKDMEGVRKLWNTLWQQPSLDNQLTASKMLVGLLKAKAGEEGWAILEKNIEMGLLPWKRDRLLPYVMHKLQTTSGLEHIRTPRDLYEYLLLDTEMGPETTTTVLHNAISTFQLYINRCRMHLEKYVTIPKQDLLEKKWAWMHHYREWEANRKVFVYPENYLQPNLRPNQSPFFNTLSQALLQGDASDENVESAFNGYLDEFAILAGLQLCGSYVYDDPTPGSKDKILVLAGRTTTSPTKTYYRTCRFIGSTTGTVWEPWQEIQLTMNSELLYPVYAFGKLFVFWVELKLAGQKDRENPETKEYKAEILYTFHNTNGRWHQPQPLEEINIGDKKENWWQELYPAYNNAKGQLYILYMKGAKATEYRYAFRLNEFLQIEKSQQGEVTEIWIQQKLPTVANVPVLTNAERDGYKYYPVVNQPDWFLVDANNGLFVCKPNVILPPISKTINATERDYNRKVLKLEAGKKGAMRTISPVILNDIDFTIDFWVKIDSHSGYILSQFGGDQKVPANGEGLIVRMEGADLFRFDFFNSGVYTKCPATNTWTHIALVYRRFGKEKAIYFNGIPQETTSNGEKIAYGGKGALFFGYECWSDTGYFSGQLSDVRIWRKALHEGEIKASMGQPFLVGNEDHLMDYWPLEGDANNKVVGRPFGLPRDVSWPDGRKKTVFSLTSSTNYSSGYTASPGFDIHRMASTAVPTLIHKLHTGGVNALLDTSTQQTRELPAFGREPGEIAFNAAFVRRLPLSHHLGFDDADGLYYREIFFHAPWLLANHLRNEQRFAEAHTWYQHVFNPTIKEGGTPPQYRWRFLPFQPDMRTAGVMTAIDWREGPPLNPDPKPYAAVFNGKTSVINAGKDIDLRAKNFTIEFWAKTDSKEAVRRYMLGIGTQKQDEGLGLFFENDGRVYFSFFFNDIRTNDSFARDDQWYHWAFVYDKTGDGEKKSGKKIYRNGELINVNIIPENQQQRPFNGAGTLLLGQASWHANTTFSGQLSEVRIWETARSEAEIRGAYKRRLNTRELNDSGLLRYWPLDKVAGNLAPNLAGVGSDALNNNESGKLCMLAANPFDPDLVAAIRPIAYKKAFAGSYIQNLLDQGDALFRVYTSESITEAIMYYVMAAELLGKRPAPKGQATSNNATADALATRWKAALELEQKIDLRELPDSITDHPALSMLDNVVSTTFCIPENEHFISYWDRLEDRLYKIRHGLNIDGIKQSLPQFALPIDPEAWLQGATGGSSIGIATATVNIPHYRFTTMLAKAKEFTAQVSQLGGALLSALEKKDAETLALLHTTHERNILELTTRLKEDQVEEARENTLSIAESIASARLREAHYTALHQEYMSPLEQAQLGTMIAAHAVCTLVSAVKTSASIFYAMPQISVGLNSGVTFGGINSGAAADSLAGVIDMIVSQLSFASNLTATLGSFHRRDQEWVLQQQLAAVDIKQLYHQAQAAQRRLQMAQRELDIHKITREQNQEIQSYMQNKFTNHELYQWMVAKISGLYFNAYQMAYDLARAAEEAFRYELMANDKFINGVYWDSLKKGLLSGEALQLDLNRMEKHWLEKTKRRLEIDRTISLMQINPIAVMKLKTTGKCEFNLTEELFSRDFPGHYGRQIKSISLSFPAVVGPYQNFNATLRQTSNRTLVAADINGFKYLLNLANGDAPSSVKTNLKNNEQVALSRGLNDSGVFELNFHDERYLPFEGTGAVSGWELTVSNSNGINLKTITDVIIHIQYTALDGGETFRNAVRDELKLKPLSEGLAINMTRDFSSQWNNLLTADLPVVVAIQPKGYRNGLENLKLIGFYVLLDLTEAGKTALKEAKLTINIQNQNGIINLTNGAGLLELNPGWQDFKGQDWILTVEPKTNWNTGNVRNMLIVAVYTGTQQGTSDSSTTKKLL